MTKLHSVPKDNPEPDWAIAADAAPRSHAPHRAMFHCRGPAGFDRLSQGHRTYLDPNPRLVSTRTIAWRVPGPFGHRAFIEPKKRDAP